MNKDDLMWKAVLEEVFEDFLRFFYADADELFDMEKGFEYLDKELEQLFPPEDNQFSPRFVDKLVKVFKKDGTEDWLLIHIEVQGQYSKDFGERMFTYYYRIKDKYDKPITAFAIFTDKNRSFHPNKFEYEYMGTSVSYKFNTYKIIEQDEEELARNPNPFSLVILVVLTALKVKEMNDEVLLGLKRNLLVLMLNRKLQKKKRNAIFSFLKYHVSFENKETMLIFDKEVQQLTGRSTTMGIEEYLLEKAKNSGIQEGIKEGIQEGIQKGTELSKQQTVKNLIEQLDLSDAQIAGIVEVPIDFVKKVREALG